MSEDDGVFARPNIANNDNNNLSFIGHSLIAPSEISVSSMASSYMSTKMLGKKRILREHEFVEGLSNVIEKQFFPDLKRLKAQAAGIEYDEEVDNHNNNNNNNNNNNFVGVVDNEDGTTTQYTAPREGDLDHLDSAQSKLFELAGLVPPSALSTSSEEKPLKVSRSSRQKQYNKILCKSNLEKKNETIDEFLSKNTSQDNYEYHKLQEQSKKEHREKHPWVYDNDKDKKALLIDDKKQQERLMLKNNVDHDKQKIMMLDDKKNETKRLAIVSSSSMKKMKNNNTINNKGSIRYNATQYDQIGVRKNPTKSVKKQRNTQDYQNSHYGGGDDHYSLVLSSTYGDEDNMSMMSGRSNSVAGTRSRMRYGGGGLPRWGSGTSSIQSSSRSNRINRMSNSARALALKLLEKDRQGGKNKSSAFS